MLTLLERPETDGLCLIRRTVWSPDGSCLVAILYRREKGEGTSTLLHWDMTSGRQKTIATVKDRIMSMTFSPDGSLLFVGLPRGVIRAWKPGVRRAAFSLKHKPTRSEAGPILVVLLQMPLLIVLEPHRPAWPVTISGISSHCDSQFQSSNPKIWPK